MGWNQHCSTLGVASRPTIVIRERRTTGKHKAGMEGEFSNLAWVPQTGAGGWLENRGAWIER